MTDKRDPRVNPKRFDSLDKGLLRRTVLRVTTQGAFIQYVTRSGEKRRCYWTDWQQWAKNAEVIHATE